MGEGDGLGDYDGQNGHLMGMMGTMGTMGRMGT